MSEVVDFYLLETAESRGRVIFACRLAAKALSQSIPVYIWVSDDQQSQAVDKLLWTFAQNSFIPHTIYYGKELDQQKFPVQIGCIDNSAHHIGLLIFLADTVDTQVTSYHRVAEIILNDEQQKKVGRVHYKFYRQAGLMPNMHPIK